MSFKKTEIITENNRHYDRYDIIVDPNQEPIRIDKYLQARIENVTRSKIQDATYDNHILVNEKPVRSNYKIRPHDKIEALLGKPPSFLRELVPEYIPLNIVYEDDHVLVINKQPGLVVHPGVGNYRGTLVNGLVHYFKSKDLPVLRGNDKDRPGIVHRIDKDTSGLMIVAKSETAMNGLSEQFMAHTIKRTYQALVWGDVSQPEGTITGHIGRHPTDRMRRYVYEDGSDGKHAVTHYKVIEDLYYVTLVQCQLETGRTHQIRVHMQYIGHPLFSDARYGGDKILKGTVYSKYKQFVQNTFEVMPRQALHAKSLGFIHPHTGEEMLFESDLPADFAAALDRWRGYTASRKEFQNDGQQELGA